MSQPRPYIRPGFVIVGEVRERIVAAYRAALGRSVDRYFAEIPDPADHPTFRIEPAG